MKALFLDRDGTINFDRVYINDPKLIELIPGAAEALVDAKNAGYLLIVVTNQSGIGRGLIPPDQIAKIHHRLDELLKPFGVEIISYKICPHAPQAKCHCRKPSAKLVLEAAKEFSLNLDQSCFIGDKWSDVQTGINAKCGTSILLRSGKGQEEEKMWKIQGKPDPQPSFVADDLRGAVDWLLSRADSTREDG